MRRDGARRIILVVVLGWCVGLAQPWGLAQRGRATKPAAPVVDSPYAITGVVINSVGGDPVPRCHLTASLTGRMGSGNRQFPAPSNGFDCDARGRFTVSVPSAGSWRLTVSARGFVSQAFDEHQGIYSSAIVLTAEAPTKEIEFRLSPEATIVGLVLDEAGEPVRNAQVSLQNVPPQSPGGVQPAGNTRGGARTDDRGMYELANLSPGEYRLMVHAQPWYTAGAPFTGMGLQGVRGNDNETTSLDPSLDFAYPVTWFPGSERCGDGGDDCAACGRYASG